MMIAWKQKNKHHSMCTVVRSSLLNALQRMACRCMEEEDEVVNAILILYLDDILRHVASFEKWNLKMFLRTLLNTSSTKTLRYCLTRENGICDQVYAWSSRSVHLSVLERGFIVGGCNPSLNNVEKRNYISTSAILQNEVVLKYAKENSGPIEIMQSMLCPSPMVEKIDLCFG